MVVDPQSELGVTTVVSFSGIDGAGKSTQIGHLKKVLSAQGLHVTTITFWDDVALLKPLREQVGQKVFQGEQGVGSPEAPIARRDKNIQSPLVNFARLVFYVLDALSLRRVMKVARAGGFDVVIFDRFIYDELANLKLESRFTLFYIKGILRLASSPDLGIVLDADPEQARARKPEYPLDFIRVNRASYLKLAQLVPVLQVIAPLSIDFAKSAVVEVVMKVVEARKRSDPVGVTP